VGLALGIVPARAQNATCIGTLSTGTYGNVTVPRNQVCKLVFDEVTVTGNIFVGSGALLVSFEATVVVNGNIILTNAAGLNFDLNECARCHVTVDGNIIAVGTDTVSLVLLSEIGGNVTIEHSGAVSIDDNLIGGNVIVNNNNAGAVDIMSINGNAISGNLVCLNNVPPPTGANLVGGKKVGQCAGL
jgi:hypothetical protein